MKINVTKPEGNVFLILGVFQQFRDQLRAHGVKTAEYDKLLKEAKQMKYDDILNQIEKITNRAIRFTGRDR